MDRRAHALLIASCLAVAACGGGGVDVTPAQNPTPSPTPSPSPSPSPSARAADVSNISVAESQTAANAAVSTVNLAVDDVYSATLAPGGAFTLPLPGGATLSGTTNCTVSGTFTYTYTYDAASGQPISYVYNYNACRYGSATAYFEYNGTGSLNYDNWSNASNYRYTFSWNVNYAYVSPSYNSSGTLNYSQVCTTTNGTSTCSTQVGSNGVTNAQATRIGNVTTISRATVRGGSVTVTFTNWVYDSSLRRATSGRVVAADDNGNSITIEVTSTGYRVTIVVSGRTTVYTVAV